MNPWHHICRPAPTSSLGWRSIAKRRLVRSVYRRR